LSQSVHLVVGLPGAFVILLQGIDSRQYGLRFGKVDSAEAREQALFLIRGVLRGGFAEVAQAGLQKPVPSGHCVDGWRVCWLAG